MKIEWRVITTLTNYKEVINSFLSHSVKSSGNYISSGNILYLFGNKIAQHTDNGIEVSYCGWQTPTTNKAIHQIINMTPTDYSFSIKKGIINVERCVNYAWYDHTMLDSNDIFNLTTGVTTTGDKI